MEDLHAGHRARLREQFLNSDPATFPDHILLELLLSYAIPRRDVNPLAHRLIKAFGSFSAVVGATSEELAMVPGVGKETATLLRVVFETHNRINRAPYVNRRTSDVRLHNVDDVGRYVLSINGQDRYETVRLLCLDSSHKVLASLVLGVGDTISADVSPRHVLEKAMFYHADSVILLHNHPSGCVVPSQADDTVFSELRALLDVVGMELTDSVIVGNRCIYSFARKHVFLFPPEGETEVLTLREYIDRMGIRVCEMIPNLHV